MSFKNVKIVELKNSIRGKTRENFLLTARQDILIQSVENNLTIIFVKEWRFFVESEQSYRSFRFFPQIAVSFQNVKIFEFNNN